MEGECERELEMESEQILTKEKAGKGLDGLRPERPGMRPMRPTGLASSPPAPFLI